MLVLRNKDWEQVLSFCNVPPVGRNVAWRLKKRLCWGLRAERSKKICLNGEEINSYSFCNWNKIKRAVLLWVLFRKVKNGCFSDEGLCHGSPVYFRYGIVLHFSSILAVELNVSDEITCKWQNDSLVRNKNMSPKRYIYIQLQVFL